MGPIPSATPAPTPARGGAKTEENSGASSECYRHAAAGDPSYRTIKGILAAGTETTAAARPTGDRGAPAHLHGPLQLFADPTAEVITLPVPADSNDSSAEDAS